MALFCLSWYGGYDDRAPGGAELHDVAIEVLVPVEDQSPIEIDKPLDHKSENLDTLFEYRVRPTNLNETTIFKIRSEVNHIYENFYITMIYRNADPEIIGWSYGSKPKFLSRLFWPRSYISTKPSAL